MRSPKDFFRPLAVGAPEPVREIPFRPSRMLHFFPPNNEKVRSKVPSLVGKVDVLVANLEDGVPMAEKDAARAGLVDVAQNVDFGSTQLWTRVNSLDSPWCLTDIRAAVIEAGHAVDVIILPKVEGAEDIHYADRLIAQLEAEAGLTRP
ncbi:MAG TPA: CoA ester lyase, partial [Acidimicrobiaceae bacterium]|nr:CoA ester lyase [Acidimicrobiaceae bacterium]